MMGQGYERRAYKRWDLSCPIAITTEKGKLVTKARTENVSDGGAYIKVPVGVLPEGALPRKLSVQISVPRTTPNTYMLEEFKAPAIVARAEPLVDADHVGLALTFEKPITLDLGA